MDDADDGCDSLSAIMDGLGRLYTRASRRATKSEIWISYGVQC